ncbi:methyltransferase domain-containing protein [Simplicispira hankyongi]|uniref:Methyltransferase domain-containing protein n=1 Tax=Simplicispira hankyongi TaxID=2315688 RepID=A0A398C6W4_9BURK|nr:methyltransferase domain-containing protein [Simplicispira hankyongi]RID98619.1 methyltransferase domain-containing protein [Simplicispira hankyongi]
MTQSIDDLHVYLRTIQEGERTSLSVLASLVPEGARVLDLGCGSGALGGYLAQTRKAQCDGLTWSEAEAQHARPHYGRVVVDDLERCDLTATFAGERYDAIVCADVLEHLSRPERVLAACRDLLTPGGHVLISVPNAGYSGLVAELLQGEFRYREEGLLDRTHLRFFTRRSLRRFLRGEHWALESLDTITRALPDSEFSVPFDSLPPPVASALLASPDALTYQFIAVARPLAVGAMAAADAEAAAEEAEDTQDRAALADARFTAELYLGQNGQFDEARKLTATGRIGALDQTVAFAIPAGTAIDCLRLDPADRPGFLHLHGIDLRSAAGDTLWHWQADPAAPSLLAGAPHSSIVWHTPLAAQSGPNLLLLSGDDPWFTLPIAPDLLAQATASGAALTLRLGWPMSADYLALAGAVQPLHEMLAQERAEHAQTSQQIDTLRGTLSQAQSRNAVLEEVGTAAQREHARWQTQAQRLQRDYDQLADHLRTIEQSTVFRATRPLVHTKMRIDRLLGRNQTPAPAPEPVPMAASPHPVDVIVPVYRGLADTQLCIDSALASPCTAAWRLIVINDASPEPEVTAWLRERAANEPRMLLLENENNLGFVGTVNRGMALSNDNDVLLLNSDTEVANDWLDRLRRAAYSDAKVASVTPFSNNATICSYPRFCKENPLPAGMTTQALDALCAQTNAGAVVDVPTGIGFCMYIRRDCLAQVGLFDTENFGKGYGEENDFCQRAFEAGWRNLHALDTFVLHTGGVSFGESKSPRERAAMETLRRLHPRYEAAVHQFLARDPAAPYRLALDVARIASTGLPVVLAVLHDRAGGTVRHVRELAAHLHGQLQMLTLTPAPERSVLLQMAGKDEAFALRFRVDDQWPELLQALRQLGVRHVHFHHLLGHDPQVAQLPLQLGVAYDFTAHDFYAYCTHISLTGNDNRFAGDPAPGTCACCQPGDPAPAGGGSVADWRHRNQHLLTGARWVLAPSRDAARRIAAFAPGARVLAVPHTDVQTAQLLPTPAPAPLAPQAPLKVVVLGALSAIKGADVLEAVALEAARQGAPVEFHLLGYAYRNLQTQPRAHLSVHGAYEDDDLPGLLQWLQPDLVWFPAQWPETYSYTLSASLQQGLPVVAPDLGAFRERLAGRPWSWVAPWDQSARDWLAFFTQIRAQNFLPGTPPQAPAEPTGLPQRADWHYDTQYLAGLAGAGPLGGAAAGSPALSLAFLDAHRVRSQGAAAGARSAVLMGVVWLRSLPVLRGVARRIPQHWQTRVKNWLRA